VQNAGHALPQAGQLLSLRYFRLARTPRNQFSSRVIATQEQAEFTSKAIWRFSIAGHVVRCQNSRIPMHCVFQS
jgi:hypothetical protein